MKQSAIPWGQSKLTSFIEKPRISYPQNWQAYDNAQCQELITFMKLLSDLCKNVEQPAYQFGRPKLSFSDMLFASALKTYFMLSLRRFMSLLRKAIEDGYIDATCSYIS